MIEYQIWSVDAKGKRVRKVLEKSEHLNFLQFELEVINESPSQVNDFFNEVDIPVDSNFAIFVVPNSIKGDL